MKIVSNIEEKSYYPILYLEKLMKGRQENET